MTAEVQPPNAILSFGPNQARLVLHEISTPLDHAEAFGRIAFACPSASVRGDVSE